VAARRSLLQDFAEGEGDVDAISEQVERALFLDYDVKSGEFTVGRISRTTNMAPPQPSWLWALNGVHGAHGVMTPTGHAQTREETMEHFAINWRRWLAWAGLQELS